MTINMRRKKIRITPGKALMFLFFAWFILACLVLPNLNLLMAITQIIAIPVCRREM